MVIGQSIPYKAKGKKKHENCVALVQMILWHCDTTCSELIYSEFIGTTTSICFATKDCDRFVFSLYKCDAHGVCTFNT